MQVRGGEPGRLVQSEAAELLRWREASRLSRRAAGRVLGVTHVTIARWEKGQTPVPERVLGQISEPVRSSSDLKVVDAAGARPGLSVLELARAAGVGRHIVDRLVEAGELALSTEVRSDSSGRLYLRPAAYLPDDLPAGERAPAPDGSWVRKEREAMGLSAAELAERIGVRPSTIRVWECGLQPVPPARAERLREVLEPIVDGVQLREARLAAGWPLKEVAARVGVYFSVVHAWENGVRPIPPKRMEAVRRVMVEAGKVAAARSEAAERDLQVEALVAEVAEHVGQYPGLTVKNLRHVRRGGARMAQMWSDAIDRAISAGSIVVVVDPGRAGRRFPRCFLPDAVPSQEGAITGGELRAARQSVALRARDIAEPLGVTPSWVHNWEVNSDLPIPRKHWDKVREILDGASRRAHPKTRARDYLVSTLSRRPGVTRYRIKHDADTLEALERMLEEGSIVEAPSYDCLGRPHRGLWLAGSAPEAPLLWSGAQLRKHRLAAGLTQRQLAERLGLKASTVTGWETGAKRIPAVRMAAIQATIAQTST